MPVAVTLHVRTSAFGRVEDGAVQPERFYGRKSTLSKRAAASEQARKGWAKENKERTDGQANKENGTRRGETDGEGKEGKRNEGGGGEGRGERGRGEGREGREGEHVSVPGPPA